MKTKILVAGATGNLGGRIVNALIERGADVRGLVRTGTDHVKLEKLRTAGAEVIALDMADHAGLVEACTGVSCVVSALQGLRDVIVDLQSELLNAAVNAGVSRFIPSDFSTDFTELSKGDNRNFDLRREFNEHLDESVIAGTSIFNGAFAEILTYNIPFLDFKNKKVGYIEDPEWRVDFTTMDDTAAFTAEAALDANAPRNLRIASFQINANELVSLASEMLHSQFELMRMGSREEFAARVAHDRAANPAGENEVFPRWQQAQYMHSMFSAQNASLDNDRYKDLKWTSAKELLNSIKR